MRKDQIFVLLLIFLLPMTGCFGGLIGDAEADDDDSDDDHPPWINDVGTTITNWSLTLQDDEWLEVKSAASLLTYTSPSNNGTQQSSTDAEQVGMTVQENSNWRLGSDSFSPIFGGEYHLCLFYEDGVCYQNHPNSQYQMVEFSIIYRIHSV